MATTGKRKRMAQPKTTARKKTPSRTKLTDVPMPVTTELSWVRDQLAGKPMPSLIDDKTWQRFMMYRAYCQLYPEFPTLIFLHIEKAKLPANKQAKKTTTVSASGTGAVTPSSIAVAARKGIEMRLAEGAYIWFMSEWVHRVRMRYSSSAAEAELMEYAMCSIALEVRDASSVATTSSTTASGTRTTAKKCDSLVTFHLSPLAFFRRQKWRIPSSLYDRMSHGGPQTFRSFMDGFAKHDRIASPVLVKQGFKEELLAVFNLFHQEDIIAFHMYRWAVSKQSVFQEALAHGSQHEFHTSVVKRMPFDFPFCKIKRQIMDCNKKLGGAAVLRRDALPVLDEKKTL